MREKLSKNKTPISVLEYMFERMKHQEIDEESIEKKDIYDEVVRTIKFHVDNDIFLAQAVFSRPSLGKSTFAMWLLMLGNQFMAEKNNKEMPDCYPKIQSDQIEMNRYRMMMCKRQENGTLERKDEFVMIDESAALSETGENSSIEGATLSDLININAQEYSNPIFVSATSNNEFSSFSSIIYHIIGRDNKLKTTLVKVHWHDHPSGRIIPLGVMKVDLQEVLESSVNERYRKKKFARMSLLSSNKRDIRSLEKAYLMKKCYDELKPFNTGVLKIPPELVELTIKQVINNESMPFSIMGESSLRKEVIGVLSADHIVSKLQKKLYSNITEEERELVEKMLVSAEKKKKELHIEMKKNIELLEKYRRIK